MALCDDVIALVHDLSSAGLAVTLIGTPVRNSEERCNSSNPTRDGGNEEPQDSDGKKQKYSSMSAEVCPTKDREVLRRKISKKIDVRYLNEIKNFKEKIKSSYTLSCNQQKCPVIQERLNQHQLIHHANYRKVDNACGTRMRIRDQAINVSPTLSRMRLPKFNLPTSDEGRQVQTDITMRDFSPNRLLQKPANKATSDFINTEIPLRKSETREVLSQRNFYKEHLQNEILNWLHHVPMFYSLNFTTKDIKDNIVNNLAEKINALAVEAQEKNYEVKTKTEIENCLNRLPMWLHGSKRDQILFKDGLREKLWNKIQELNENFLGIRYEKAVGNEKQEEKIEHHELYEKEVVDWSLKLHLNPEKCISRRQVVDLIMKRLSPLLKIPLHTTSYKLILKGQIIDILDDLPLTLTSPRYRTVHLNRFAEELANRLLNIQIRQESSSPQSAGVDTPIFHQYAGQVTRLPIPKSLCNLKDLISNSVGECLDKIPVCHRNDLKTEICSSFLDSKARLRTGNEMSINDEICQFLRDTGKISRDKTQAVANMILAHVKNAVKDARNSATTSFDSVMPQLSGALSVYRWGTERPPATSTPKKLNRKEIPKLSPEERSYMEKVAALIRTWMDTLPKQFNEEPNYKETVVYDLAGDIMDHLKVEQLAPDTFTDKNKYQNYLMYRWLYKFDFFDDSTIRYDAKPLIGDFLRKLKDIPVPKLTASQHGTRQAMEHIKHMEGERGWEEDYVPKGIDVLEDQISVWMNEQPSEIYSTKDKAERNKVVHDLALNLQDHLRNKSPESEIERDINECLRKVVNSKEKEHIGLLTQDLKEKIINIPQDQTLAARQEERKRYMLAKLAAKRQMREGQPSAQHTQDVSNIGNIEGDPDRTIREFIGEYIEHYYDIDDPMATGAFAHLLKTELRKLAPLTRKEVYDNFKESKTHEKFKPETLKEELEYIKIISDWLNNIPIEASYNTPGNKHRIEFINDLAKNIQEIEEQRIQNPDVMEYNYLTASMILQSMHTYDLPILREHKDNTPLMVQQLLQKLVDIRPSTPSDTYASQPSSLGNESLGQSLNMSDIKEQNLSEFIADYIRVNGRDIADDEIKLEAWTARLMKEIKKIIQEGVDPATLTKAQVYEKFAGVPIPTEEAVKRYCLEIYYVKEITDWMKNLPLLPIENQLECEERIKMICELSEKMCDTVELRRAYPNDNSADKKLEGYIATWISRLPLDKSKEIIIPILIQQLMSRLEKGSKKDPEALHHNEPQTSAEISKTVSVDNTENKSENKDQKKSKSMDNRDSKQSFSKRISKDLCPLSFLRGKPKTPAEIIVEAIENWSNKLPIKLDDKEAVKSMKEGIARKLYQKTGELNVDPRIFNDDLLYREMLGDEIDTQLENVPQNPELQKNRQELKDGLLNIIIETNKIIKQSSAGDNYRHKLETTIDASIPNPVQSTQAFDPGFEIYKNHLANMFILENFDHANDDVKANYEKRIRYEIDKYFESAQNKNALPLTKDQIYNEIYSALFKVPMPHENSVINEVEQIKTRCEVDAWYEELPIQHTDNITELLERDKILSTLAKRIHEIEKNDSKSDENILKEIRKWLEKLPLLPGHQGIDVYAKKLQSILKSTATARKYVPTDQKASKGKCKQVKESTDKNGSKDPNTSQVPGPSGVLQSKATNAKPCLLVSPMTHKKPGDIIVEVVEEWCNQLPLISSEENSKAIKDNISTRIIILISELNMDSEIFNDDAVYNELLDEELENVMSNLPVYSDFDKSKPARKYQLKEIINSIKPLIKEEKARYEYKEELNSTVANILKQPQDASAEKLALFNKLKEDIIENFVQFNYNKNDEESRQIYKNQVHDAVVKYCIEVRDKGTGEQVDPLVRRNQLLCELEKIPVPQAALKEEIAEIKMKKEVEQFLREQSIPEEDAGNKIKKHLAKRLCDIEKSGYNPPNEKKMKSDITRCLKKIKIDISPKAVDDFVNKLKNNEAERKTPPMTSSQAAYFNQEGSPSSPKTGGTGMFAYQTYQPAVGNQKTSQTPQQKYIYSHVPTQSGSEQHWVSLPETLYRMPDSSYHTPYAKDFRPDPQVWSPHAHPFDQSLGESTMGYEDFERGNFLSSSVAPHGYAPDAQSQLNGFAGSRPNPNASHGRPSSHLSQKSLSKSYQQDPRISMKEVTSGPTLARPSFGQIATPRQVAQSPHLSQTPQGSASPGNATPDSLFQAPVFKPVPFHRPLPVPIIEPVALPGSAASIHDPRRPLTSQENALIPSPRGLPMQAVGRPMVGDRRPRGFESSDDEEICICERCTRRSCRGIPFCMLAMEQYFEECLGIPMWCGMHLPECFYY